MNTEFPFDPIAAATHPDPYPDAVLVVLAAANRDTAGKPFSFGAGPHACPGETLAITIAQAGVEALLEAGVDLQNLAENVTYRPSANCRIPLF